MSGGAGAGRPRTWCVCRLTGARRPGNWSVSPDRSQAPPELVGCRPTGAVVPRYWNRAPRGECNRCGRFALVKQPQVQHSARLRLGRGGWRPTWSLSPDRSRRAALLEPSAARRVQPLRSPRAREAAAGTAFGKAPAWTRRLAPDLVVVARPEPSCRASSEPSAARRVQPLRSLRAREAAAGTAFGKAPAWTRRLAPDLVGVARTEPSCRASSEPSAARRVSLWRSLRAGEADRRYGIGKAPAWTRLGRRGRRRTRRA